MEAGSRVEEGGAVGLRGGRAPGWVRAGFWVCLVIAVAVVMRRLVALAYPSPSAPPQLAELDAVFAAHAGLTLAHIVPALLFVLLAPVFYARRFAGAMWPARALLGVGAVVGATAYAMSVYPV